MKFNEKITNFKIITENPEKLSLLEFEFNVEGLSEEINPYKEEDIAVVMEISSNDTPNFKIDAFYFAEYEFDENYELKGMGPEGRTEKPACFRFRFNPKVAGEYNYTVKLIVKGELKDTISGSVNVSDNDKVSRLAEVESKCRRVFATPDGKPFAVIGENICWNNHSKIKTQFGQYIANQMKILSEHGCNYTRIWDYVETGSRIKAAPHVMSQDGSAMWDHIFKSADECNYYISFCLNPHGEVSTSTDSSYGISIWNKDNGGFIENAADFFINSDCIAAIKTYLRYIIARWGYTESILCWELFNEIDHCDALAKYGMINEVKAWLKEMADYIRQKDIYGHMVSNSASAWVVFASSDPFDFIFYHMYNFLTLNQAYQLCHTTWRGFNKPVVVGEAGIDGPVKQMSNQRIGEDLLELHQGNWSCLMGSSAGTGMSWWWEEVEAKQGNSSFVGVSKMAKQIPWDDSELISVTNETVKCFNNRINTLGYKGESYAYLWFYDNKHLPPTRYEITEFKNEKISLPLKDGEYRVRWMDTRLGEYVEECIATAENGLMLDMPDWKKDIALIVESV